MINQVSIPVGAYSRGVYIVKLVGVKHAKTAIAKVVIQ
jgi:hypothetical protein